MNFITKETLNNPKLSNLLKSYGLDIQSVAWEDSARYKGSCYGPNISDMTLNVNNTRMPIIRKPNFFDITYDLPIDFFKVCVGNESDGNRKIISLKELIKNINIYTGNPLIKNLLCERDDIILSSTQCCLLQCAKNKSVNFSVDLYNYQSQDDEPAVLVLTSSKDGTSIQVLDSNNEKLYFNDNGEAFDFKAERLADVRKKRTGKDHKAIQKYSDMSSQEKLENTIMVFQIPLKRKQKVHYRGFECTATDSMIMEKGEINECCTHSGVDMGVLSRGDHKGEYKGTKNLELERDTRFPIRCTFQWYRVTDSSSIEESVIQDIAHQFRMFQDKSSAFGSLVHSTTDRKTEPNLTIKIPTDNPYQKEWDNNKMLPFL